MKRKISKKVLCLCMVAVLAVGLAIPAFANGEIRPLAADGESITSAANTYYQLNCNVANTPVNGTTITVYRNTNHPSQRWMQETVPGTTLWYFASSANTGVILVYNGTPQAVMGIKRTGLQTMQAIKVVRESTSTEGYMDNGLVLPDHLLALTASSLTSNGAVKWLGPNSKKNQLWLFQMYPSA